MAPVKKVFLTGVTGYIGGDAFYALHEAYPDWKYTLLIRSEDKGKIVKEKYPDVNIVYGGLGDSELIVREAAAADIVVHTAESSDDNPSAEAIAKGLAQGHSADNPGFWLHVCGTGILTGYDTDHKRYGEPPLPEESYDDVADIARILTIPDHVYHRSTDKIVLAASSSSSGAVRTAIVGPPTIYGTGRGPVNTRSKQLPTLAKYTLEHGYAPIIGRGLTEWDHVNVTDLSAFFVTLAAAAADVNGKGSDKKLFQYDDSLPLDQRGGYFFLESGTHVWADVARKLAKVAAQKEYIAEEGTRVIDIKDAPDPTWGLNSKSKATRARKFLGWEPKGHSFAEEIELIVDSEAKELGIKPGAKVQAK